MSSNIISIRKFVIITHSYDEESGQMLYLLWSVSIFVRKRVLNEQNDPCTKNDLVQKEVIRKNVKSASQIFFFIAAVANRFRNFYRINAWSGYWMLLWYQNLHDDQNMFGNCLDCSSFVFWYHAIEHGYTAQNMRKQYTQTNQNATR